MVRLARGAPLWLQPRPVADLPPAGGPSPGFGDGPRADLQSHRGFRFRPVDPASGKAHVDKLITSGQGDQLAYDYAKGDQRPRRKRLRAGSRASRSPPTAHRRHRPGCLARPAARTHPAHPARPHRRHRPEAPRPLARRPGRRGDHRHRRPDAAMRQARTTRNPYSSQSQRHQQITPGNP